MRRIFAVGVLLLFSAPAYCWNNTGHMIVARLAWLNLDQAQKDKSIEILKKHPHYQEFLKADVPNGFTEAEWVFLRAATWPDWVRSNHREFSRPKMHYINYPFVPQGSNIDPSVHQPGADQDNILKQLKISSKQVTSGNQEDRAVHFCWILHLMGDIHQPLHSSALFSSQFPDGDLGGNLAYIVLHDGAHKIKLHPTWDGLLGTSNSASAIGRIVLQVHSLSQSDQEQIQRNITQNTDFESWAKESFEVAKKSAYLDGALPLGDDHDDAVDIGIAPTDYIKNAGHIARIQVGKAGKRLANTVTKLVSAMD
jgi:hypothetical protein